MVEFYVAIATLTAKCRFGRHREILRITPRQFAGRSTVAVELTQMAPEFFLVLKGSEFHRELEDSVFEAGFDDSELTVRGGHPAIWVCHRTGELTELVRAALEQARIGGLTVDHVEIDNDVFAGSK